MASTHAIWGIDVGRCALKALKLRSTADAKVEIVAHAYVEHPTILSQPEADRTELIAAALEKFLSGTDISKDLVVVSVPGQHTLARFTKLPPVSKKQIPAIVRYEADQQIPFDMDDVIWDYQTFAQEDMPDLEVGIFAMKRELLREHLLHFEQAAIEPIAVQSCPLALYNAAHFDGLLSSETTVLLDIGAENTDLVVATPAGLWTRTIPIGGNNFTEALVKAFKLSFGKAESLKRTAETSKYRRQIFQAMRPVFADLVQELQRSIGFYSSTHRDAQIDKVVGAGNAFKLPGLQKYLHQNLGFEVGCAQSFKKVVPSDAAQDEELTEQICSFSVAYGLALQGLDLAKITSNLLPVEIAKQVVWRKKKPAFGAAAACLVLAGSLIWFRHSTDMRALAGTPAGAELVQEQDQLKSTLNDLMEQGKPQREETEKLVELQNNKALVPILLQMIHDSLPQPDAALAKATTVEEFLEALNSAPPREKRNQVFLQSLSLHYEPDLNGYVWEPVGEVEPSINPSDQPISGFKIEIECTTPNEGGAKFIQDTLMDGLKKNGRKPGTGYYVDRVYLIDGAKVEVDDTASFGGGGGWGGGMSSRSTPAATAASLARDPITNEPMTEDWKFVIWADVILQDYPEAEDEEPAEDAGDE